MYKTVTLSDDPWSEQLKSEIRATPHYQTLIQWQNCPSLELQKTAYYKWLKDMFDKDGCVWGGILKTEEDILRQCNNFRQMYLVAPKWETADFVARIVNNQKYYFGPITARVFENGSLEIIDGHHRSAIQLFKKMPIQMVLCERMTGWKNLLHQVRELYSLALYQPIHHPEFQDWPCSYSTLKTRTVYKIVEGLKPKSVLDLGCCHGHTIYSIRNIISFATGVESDITRYEVTKLLFTKVNNNFICYNQDIVSFVASDQNKYDVVFALAVFHHVMRYVPQEQFMDFLQQIKEKTKVLIYEIPEADEEQYSWMYKDFDLHKVIREKFTNWTFLEFALEKRKLVVAATNLLALCLNELMFTPIF
ncbi:MAG: class I SAM-dependent methyltransferase [Nitrosarchaeum sp.]|nr:class I SAM-dependent methyltransferase [Nitrosarchaeum sp.]